MVGKYTCITFCLIEKQSIFYGNPFFFKRLNIADILFCEDVVSLTDIHDVNTRKKFLFVISPTWTSYLKTRLFLGISEEEGIQS